MKNNLKFTGLLLLMFAFSPAVIAQTSSKTSQPIASDAPGGYTYDFNKTMDLIIERITAPSKSNADVKVFLDQKDFPAPPATKGINAAYKDQIRIWMEKNPNLIINTLKHRKDIVTQF